LGRSKLKGGEQKITGVGKNVGREIPSNTRDESGNDPQRGANAGFGGEGGLTCTTVSRGEGERGNRGADVQKISPTCERAQQNSRERLQAARKQFFGGAGGENITKIIHVRKRKNGGYAQSGVLSKRRVS